MGWLWNKFIENGTDFVDSGPPEGILIDLVNTLSLLALLIGCFFIMAGNKKIGTKITSITVVVYIVVKACGVYA